MPTLEDRIRTTLTNIHEEIDRAIRALDKSVIADLRAEIKEELRQEASAQAAEVPPTPEDREALIDFAFDLEGDLQARAVATSLVLDEGMKRYRAERPVRSTFFYGLLVSFVPVIGFLVGFLHWSPENFRLWAVIVSHGVAFTAVAVSNFHHEERHEAFVKKYTDFRAAFQNVAMRAQIAYKVEAFTSTSKTFFAEKARSLNEEKSRLADGRDQSVAILDQARRIVLETYPERGKPIVHRTV